jgi:alpha-mannosidase
MKPEMIREILFVHHTHTDIGYTHPQPVVFELHRRFIDEALDIADETADWPDECRFRWTCEVTGITLDWWRHAPDRERERFLAAVKRGQFEVAAMAWHMTPLMDHGMVVDVLQPIRFFRELGIPVRSAMNTDVNGLPWGVVDALLDHGIGGLSMAINEHFGHALRPWPRAFRWQAPSGRTLLAYNGFIYGVTSDRNLSVPVDLDEARKRVPEWAKLWEGRGYPHPFLMMQITNIRYHDNGSPQAALPDFIRRFNETDPAVRLRFITLSDFFDRLRSEPEERLPLMRGDWTDWWNFGSGSTAHETAQALAGQRHLDDALGLEAWHPGEEGGRRPMLREAARRALTLYAEHTWGADRSIREPLSPETRTQLLLKLALAPEGASLARMLRRDGLERLAEDAGGDGPRLLVHNPHPFPVRRSLRLPYLPPLAGAPEPQSGIGVETFVPTGPSSHRIQRQDVVLADIPDEAAFWSAPIDVPALSYVTLPAAEVRPGAGALRAEGNIVSNGRLTVALDGKRGGVTSLMLDGVEYAGAPAPDARFGVPVLERVEAATRDAIFDKIDIDSPDWHRSWHTDWQARRDLPDEVSESRALVARGRAEVGQAFTLPSGDVVRVVYRMVPDDPALELEVIVDKAPLAEPHALYLPLPVAIKPAWQCHFETGGAVVRLDDEQLPYASRHYITTQRFIRIADDAHELTVACPDAPLWQIGGYTFGRHREPDGGVARERPLLLAWLTNNYWMTNFQADQGGRLRFRFWLLPGPVRSLGAAAQAALAYTRPPAAHLYAGHGELRHATATLFEPSLGPLLLTRLEADGDGVALTLLNPEDEAVEAVIRGGALMPAKARRTTLSGEPLEELACDNGTVTIPVEARAWTRVVLENA